MSSINIARLHHDHSITTEKAVQWLKLLGFMQRDAENYLAFYA
jgi:hypothetical protein